MEHGEERGRERAESLNQKERQLLFKRNERKGKNRYRRSHVEALKEGRLKSGSHKGEGYEEVQGVERGGSQKRDVEMGQSIRRRMQTAKKLQENSGQVW